MVLADRLKLARSKRGLTQDELADRCNLSNGYISMLERAPGAPNSIKSPGFAALRDLAKALDVPLEWLADGEGEEPEWPEENKSAAGGGAR